MFRTANRLPGLHMMFLDILQYKTRTAKYPKTSHVNDLQYETRTVNHLHMMFLDILGSELRLDKFCKNSDFSGW